MTETTTVSVLNAINDTVPVTGYLATYHTGNGWCVSVRPDGLYDIYGPYGNLRASATAIPFMQGIGQDPRDGLGYVPV